MDKIIFKDYSSTGGLTVGKLSKLLLDYPSDMKITVRTLTEHFPATTVKEGEYKLYPIGCNGIAQGKQYCLHIE